MCLYSSSLSYSGAVCWAGLSTVREGTWLRDDSSFSVLEPGGAVFMGAAVRAARGRNRVEGWVQVTLTCQLHMNDVLFFDISLMAFNPIWTATVLLEGLWVLSLVLSTQYDSTCLKASLKSSNLFGGNHKNNIQLVVGLISYVNKTIHVIYLLVLSNLSPQSETAFCFTCRCLLYLYLWVTALVLPAAASDFTVDDSS